MCGYSPIPEKLVTKIRTGQFVDLADLLAENLKAQESEPHTYLDGKLLVSSSKKRVQEITDIITWVETFTIFSWIFCSTHPSRWQDLTQYKLLIIKTSCQFPGKAWLRFRFLVTIDWSHFHEECDRLREVFCKLKYPQHLIDTAIKKLIDTKVFDPQPYLSSQESHPTI